MKLAYLANFDGDPARLEALMLCLLEQHEVDGLVPVGASADPVMAAVARRAGRLPPERGWTDPGFADFVLQAVLGGVAQDPTPREEVERTHRLQSAVSVGLAESHTLGNRRVAAVAEGGEPPAGIALIITDSAKAGVDRGADPPRVHPGQLRAGDGGTPASCVTVEPVGEGADAHLRVVFVGGGGQVMATELIE